MLVLRLVYDGLDDVVELADADGAFAAGLPEAEEDLFLVEIFPGAVSLWAVRESMTLLSG